MNKKIRLSFLLLVLMLLATGLMPQNGSQVRAASFDPCQDCRTECWLNRAACLQAGSPLSFCNAIYVTCVEDCGC